MMTRLLALMALLVFPASALAQEAEEQEAEETEPTPPAAAEPAPVQPPTTVRLREPMGTAPRTRLVQPLQAPVVEPIEPAGDPNEIMPAQAIEPAEDDVFEDEAFPEDPAADEAVEQALDDGFADEEGWDEEEALDEHAAEAGDVHTTEAVDHADEHGPGAPHDEEHGEAHGPNWPAMILNFLLWGAIIVWLLKKPLTSFLQNRRTAVIEGLEESRRIKEEAEAKHAEYTERLAHLDDELAKLRQEMIQAGEAERDRIIAEAESRAARMRRDAQFVVDQQMKQLKKDLTREAIEAAVKAAEEVLTAQTGAADQERLAKAYLGDVASSMSDKEKGEVQA